MSGTVEYMSPEGLHKNPAYSQVVVTRGTVRTVYVGGQNAVNASGEVVGRGDVAAQTEQAFENLRLALAAAGADLTHVVKWNIYLVQGQPIQPAFEVFRRIWGQRSDLPPTITVLYVAGLANPDFLAEIDAIAAVPED
ncbi:MAG TPA: RidA family protein [Chloroflexi bacterium]|jgi:enamine deaminase RidA (YjgF/YER057c/UK114 family)|nr:RidA family protein [Chloroflexota bacterium]